MTKLLLLTPLFLIATIPGPAIVIDNPQPAAHYISAEVTGYTSSPEETDSDPFTMASGKRVYDGAIACPRAIEFGTVIEIDSKQYTCEDRMNIRYDNRFDVWFSDRQQALEFGIQNKLIKIYE